MKQDIFFRFEKAKPFRSVVYSRESARELALERACIAFMIGFPILAVFYEGMLSFSMLRLRSKKKKRQFFIILFSLLLFVCISISIWSYIGVGEKIDVVSFSSSLEREWRSFIDLTRAHMADTDIDFMELREKEKLVLES